MNTSKVPYRWNELSILQQMGNLGSEIGRSFKSFVAGDEQLNSAFERALELFDLTLSDSRWKGTGRLKEIARCREIFCSIFFGNGKSEQKESDINFFNYYFLQFGEAANNERLKLYEARKLQKINSDHN